MNFGYATLQIIPSMRGAKAAMKAELDSAGTDAGGSSSRGFLAALGAGLKGVGGVILKAVGATGGIFAALFGGAAFTKGMARVTTIQDSTKALEVLLGDAAKAGQFMDEIVKTVTGTPFNLDQFAEAGKNLVAFGADAQKVPGYLTAIGESAAASGKGADAVNMIVDALGKATAAGKIGMETVNSLSAQGVPALQILANQYGVTTDEIRKMISAGLIPAEEGIDKLTQGIIEGTNGAAGATVAFGGSMEGLRTTITGAWGGLGAATARFGAAFIQPFQDEIPKVLNATADVVDAVAGRIKPVMEEIAASGIGDRIAGAIAKIPDAIAAAQPWIDEIIGGFRAMFAAFSDGEDHITSSGLAGFLEGVGVVARNVWDALAPLADVAKEAFSQMAQQAGGLFEQLGPALGQIGEMLGGLFAELAPAIEPLIGAFIEISGVVRGALLEAILALVPIGIELVQNVLAALQPILPTIVSAIGSLASTFAVLLQALAPVLPVVAELAGELIAGLAPLLPTIADLVARLAQSLGGALAGAVGAVLPILTTLLEAGFTILEPLLPVIVSLVESLGSIFITLVEAVTPLLEPIGNLIAQLVEGLSPILGILIEVIVVVAGVLVELLEAFSPILPIIGDLLAIVVDLINIALEPVVAAITIVADILSGLLSGAFENIMPIVTAVIETVMGFIKMLTGTLQPTIRSIASVIGNVWDGIKRATSTTWDAIKTAIWTPIEWVSNKVQGAFDAIKAGMSAAADGAKIAVSNAFGALAGIIKPPINAIIDGVNTVIRGLNNVRVPDWVPRIGGQGVNIPTIPRLAKGATVLPKPGGTLAVLAEAGRAETVVDTGLVNSQLAAVTALVEELRNRGTGDNDGAQVVIHQTNHNPVDVPTVVQTRRALEDVAALGVLGNVG